MPGRAPPELPSHPFAAGVRGVHHSQISNVNQRAVLTMVSAHPGITNAEISRRTGLGAQTVSRFLQDLENKGLIRRGAVLRGQPGQPATPYFLVYESVGAIGVEIGWRHIDVVLTDMSGELRRWRASDHAAFGFDGTVARVRRMCGGVLDSLTQEERGRVIGLGLAMPAGLPGDGAWKGDALAAEVEAATGFRTIRHESGNAACWAEHVGPQSRWGGNLLLVHIDAHVLSGCVLLQTLWRGAAGRGAEFGRMRAANGRIVDEEASLAALEARLAAAGMTVPPGRPDYWDWDELGRPGRDWLDAAAGAIAEAVVDAEALLGFDHVLIGGVLPEAVKEEIVDRVIATWQPRIAARMPVPNVETGRAGPCAPAVGASFRVMYEGLFSREAAG